MNCPTPIEQDCVTLAHGGGGRRMHQFLNRWIRGRFGTTETDAFTFRPPSGELAFSTDSFVVSPLFFPGGDIGRLSVYGTANDLAMMGAEPRWLSLSLILEEGLPFEALGRVLDGVAAAADECGVSVVTGDTKVVERGHGDQLFINTAGIGVRRLEVGPHQIRAGQQIVVSGDLGRHAISVMATREGIALEGVQSDCGNLWPQVRDLRVRCLRDLTRGGLAAALVELSGAAGVRFVVAEDQIPVSEPVRGAIELMGLDVLNLACEGRFVALVEANELGSVLEALPGACRVGEVVPGEGVGLLGPYGGERRLVLPASDPLPRIC